MKTIRPDPLRQIQRSPKSPSCSRGGPASKGKEEKGRREEGKEIDGVEGEGELVV